MRPEKIYIPWLLWNSFHSAFSDCMTLKDRARSFFSDFFTMTFSVVGGWVGLNKNFTMTFCVAIWIWTSPLKSYKNLNQSNKKVWKLGIEKLLKKQITIHFKRWSVASILLYHTLPKLLLNSRTYIDLFSQYFRNMDLINLNM